MYINVFWSNVYKFPLSYKQLKIEFIRIKSICQLEIVQCFIYGFDTKYGDDTIIHKLI